MRRKIAAKHIDDNVQDAIRNVKRQITRYCSRSKSIVSFRSCQSNSYVFTIQGLLLSVFRLVIHYIYFFEMDVLLCMSLFIPSLLTNCEQKLLNFSFSSKDHMVVKKCPLSTITNIHSLFSLSHAFSEFDFDVFRDVESR